MRLLLLGANGQLGRELTRALAPIGELLSLDRRGVDLTDFHALQSTVRSHAPQVIINAAAYTHVDRAESESDLAFQVNAEAPAVLATEAARAGALLVHYSTDYVFDGAVKRPYTESDSTGPLNVYGGSKLAGDQAVIGSGADALVFRIGWVYSRYGTNFLNKIQQLARERDQLKVVADQYGSPTWAAAIADASASAIAQWLRAGKDETRKPASGVYHMASPDHTTWYEFASAIVEQMDFPAGKTRPPVLPITTAEFPTPSRRPGWTVLDSSKLRETFGIGLAPWRDQLQACLSAP